LIHEPHLAVVIGEGDPYPQVLFILGISRLHEHLTAHPEMNHQG